MAKIDFDVVVIGAGTGGYIAAIKAAQLGQKVACIDKWLTPEGKPALGGTCLNVGCIPSKAMLESSHRVEDAKHGFDDHGINVGKVSVDLKKMLARKNKIISDLTGGVEMIFMGNRIKWFQGKGMITGPNEVEFVSHNNKEILRLNAKNIIIATGSVPASINFANFDGKFIVDSEVALSWDEVPKNLGIIGAGVIGLELGSVWNRLGAKVTLMKNTPKLFPHSDPDASRSCKNALIAQGLNFIWDIKIDGIKVIDNAKKGKQVQVSYHNNRSDKPEIAEFDKLIVAIGRRPYIDGIVHESIRLKFDDRGRIDVDDKCRTNIPNVYAIGDCVRGDMLAHKSSEEGVMVAELIATGRGHVNYDAIPMVIYTHPEMAWVGITEEEAVSRGHSVKTGLFEFSHNGRAKAANASYGLVKIISDSNTDRVLGCYITGHNASELIGQAVMALEWEAVTEDLQRIIFAHPSMSEVIHEAALDVDNKSLHSIGRKKK